MCVQMCQKPNRKRIEYTSVRTHVYMWYTHNHIDSIHNITNNTCILHRHFDIIPYTINVADTPDDALATETVTQPEEAKSAQAKTSFPIAEQNNSAGVSISFFFPRWYRVICNPTLFSLI